MRLQLITEEFEIGAMVAADSFDLIADRAERMVTSGRPMVLAVREFTYTQEPPEVFGGLRLNTDDRSGGVARRRTTREVWWQACLTAAGNDWKDQQMFGFGADIYRDSGGESEAALAKRFFRLHAVHDNFAERRRDMTRVGFAGGIKGERYQRQDSIVIASWNRDGVCTEKVLGFEYTDGSW